MIYWILGIVFVAGGFTFKQEISDVIEEHMDSWTQYDALFMSAQKKYAVDWRWLKAFALNESNLGQEKSVAYGILHPEDAEKSKSSDGKSWGLMQVTLTTAQSLDPSATVAKLNDPAYSIDLAAKYVAQLKKMFSPLDLRFLEYVVKSYNQGPGNTKNEIKGSSPGYANEYWSRFQRNLNRVLEAQ